MPRPHVSQERKQQIVQAAAVTFSRLGFTNTRMEDIAEEAKLSKGTLYLYFPSKEVLLEDLLHYLFIPLSTALEVLSSKEESAVQRLLNYTNRVLDEFERLRTLYPLLFEFFALATRQMSVQMVITTHFRAYQTALMTVIQEGINAGEFERKDPASVAAALMASVEGCLLLAATVPELIDVRHQGSQTVGLLIDAIRKI